jgi:hypothetical protein
MARVIVLRLVPLQHVERTEFFRWETHCPGWDRSKHRSQQVRLCMLPGRGRNTLTRWDRPPFRHPRI